MHACSLVKNLLNIHHSCLVRCVNRIYYFRLCLFASPCFHQWSEYCVWKCVGKKRTMSISSLALMGLKQEMIIEMGLPLNVAYVILDGIFSVLFCDFKPRGLRSLPTPPMVALTEFFHVHAETNVRLLPVP